MPSKVFRRNRCTGIAADYLIPTDWQGVIASVFPEVFALYNYADGENGIAYLLDPRLNAALSSKLATASNALYDPSQALHSEWLDNPIFQEQLLHELIHYA